MEIIKSFDPLLNHSAFFGFESNDFVNTGLGFGAEKGNLLVAECLKQYDPLLDGKSEYIGCPILNTTALMNYGLIKNGQEQDLKHGVVYPADYFNPFDDAVGKVNKTENTFSIHWYSKSWLSKKTILRSKTTRILHRLFGVDFKQKLLRFKGYTPSIIFAKIKNKIANTLWRQAHKKVREEYRRNYTGNNPTIISCNCIGGVLYHELGLQFASPTINLWLNCPDFIKFCEKLEHYCSLPVKEYNGPLEYDYPLGVIDDIVVHFMHYSSLEEATQKWYDRIKRINWDNIFIMATDRDGFNNDLLERFDALPYKNKKLFTHLPMPNSLNTVYIKGFENNQEIGRLMDHQSKGKYVIDQFDWVNWLNNN